MGGDLELNAEMVTRGASCSESEFAHDDRLYWIEQEPRDRKLGLWALPAKERMEPWEWRKRKRGPSVPGATGPAQGLPESASKHVK